MAGKYEAVAKGLPRELRGDPKFRERVDAVKAQLPPEQKTAVRAAALYETYRAWKEELQKSLDEAQVRLSAAEETMWDAFEREGVSSLKLESGCSVSVTPAITFRVAEPDKLRAWMVANGLEGKLTVNSQWLTAACGDRAVEGEPLPDGVVMSGAYNKTNYRRG